MLRVPPPVTRVLSLSILLLAAGVARGEEDMSWLKAPSKPAWDVSFSAPGCYASGTAFGTPGIAITSTRASTAIYQDVDGTEHTCQANEIRVDPYGLVWEPQRTNLALNSDSPAGQTITVTTGKGYRAWVKGSGYMTVTAGTAVIRAATTGGSIYAYLALPCAADSFGCPFYVTTGGTITLGAPVGTVTFIQVEDGNSKTSPIHTAGSTVTRAADSMSAPTPPNLGTSFCAYTNVRGAETGWYDDSTWSWFGLGTWNGTNSTIFWAQLGAWATRTVSTNVVAPGSPFFQAFGYWRLDSCNNAGAVSVYQEAGTPSTGTRALTGQPTTMAIGGSSVSGGYSPLRLARVTLTNKSTFSARARVGRRIAVVGDSISTLAFGATNSSNSGPMNQGAGAVGRVDSYGVSATQGAAITTQWRTSVQGQGYTDLIVEGGVNDIHSGHVTGTDAWTNYYKVIVDEALAAGLTVYRLGVTPCGGYCTAGEMTERDTINALAAAYNPSPNYHYISPDALSDGAGAYSTTKCWGGASCDSGDHLHPSTPAGMMTLWRDVVGSVVTTYSRPGL